MCLHKGNRLKTRSETTPKEFCSLHIKYTQTAYIDSEEQTFAVDSVRVLYGNRSQNHCFLHGSCKSYKLCS